MACNYQNKIVSNGLVLCLDAADKKSYPGSGATWFDRSGRQGNGVSANSINFVSNDQKSLFLNGNDFINLSLNTSSFTTEATLSIFLKLLNSTPAVGNLSGIEKLSRSTIKEESHYPWTDGQAYLGTFLDNNIRINNIVLSSTVIRTNWHMITITCSPGANNWKFFQNTELIKTATGPSNIFFSSDSIYSIGGSSLYKIQGNISNVLMYNKALNPEEIKQNFNTIKGRFGI